MEDSSMKSLNQQVVHYSTDMDSMSFFIGTCDSGDILSVTTLNNALFHQMQLKLTICEYIFLNTLSL